MNIARCELELQIIGSILNEPKNFISQKKYLSPERFKESNHKRIMAGILSCVDSEKMIDLVNIVLDGKLTGDERIYLSDIKLNNGHLETLAKKLTECELSENIEILVRKLNTDDEPLDKLELIKDFENKASALIEQHKTKDKVDVLGEYIDFLQSNAENGEPTISTTSQTMNAMLNGGFRFSDYVLLGGTAGSGKTSLMLSLAYHSARNGIKTTFIEGEMSSNEILVRLNGITSGVSCNAIRNGKHYEQYSQKFISGLYDLPFELIIAKTRTLESLTDTIRTAIYNGSKFIMADYLQVFRNSKNAKDEFEAIKLTSEKLRQMALVHGVCIFVASALNRNEFKADKLSLASFYGSSGLGHDATCAMILQGEQDGNAELVNPHRNVILNIVKNRSGVIGEIGFDFELDTQRFSEHSLQASKESENIFMEN